jgi:tetratricopeptide (TPR) repeat protein
MDDNNQFDDLWQLLLANNGTATLEAFDEILADNPDDANAWIGRGCVLSQLNNYSTALDSFSRAIQIGNSNDLAGAFSARAFVYYKLNKLEKALDDCERSLEINPNESIVWKMKGIFLSYIRKYHEALECFNKGLELNPNDQSLLELRDFLVQAFEKNKINQFATFLDDLQEYEESFFVHIKHIIEELNERFKYNERELEESDKFLEKILVNGMYIYLNMIEYLFKDGRNLLQIDNKSFSSYYHIKAIGYGMKGIYPKYDQEKIEESRHFFAQAEEFAKKDNDYDHLNKINSTREIIEKRFEYELYQITKNTQNHSSLFLSKNQSLALGIGAFGIILLLSGQWFIGLLGLGIAWYFWNKY